MTTEPARTAPTNQASPSQDRPETKPAPTRSGSLLAIVQSLITFGKGLLVVLQAPLDQETSRGIPVRFSTSPMALIIARITRGLLMAAALNDRLVRIAKRLDNPPKTRALATRTPPARPRPPRATAVQPDDDAALLASIPTAEEIAALIRNRSIGRVLEDICMDLGILPSDALWQQLSLSIVVNGGNFVRLFRRMMDRAFPAAKSRFVGATNPIPFAPLLQIATGPP